MKSRLAWIGLLFSTFLVACPQLPTTNPRPQTPAPTAFKPTLLGSVTFDFDSRTKITKARFDHQTRATTFPAETEFQITPAFFEAQTPTAGTDRFLNARFNISNLSAATDYSNLSFIAYHRQKLPNLNVSETAFFNIQDFGGGSSNAATWAKQLRPTHGMKPDGGGGYVVDDTHADMQIFSPSETSTIQADAQGTLINNGVAGEGVLQYGYVARNATNGRNIVHGTTNNTLTIGLRVPQNGDAGAGNNAYRYSMTFLIFADNITRVSESLEEQGVGSTASARAAALTAQVAYLCNSSLTGGVFIPGAKTAGVSNATAWIGGNIKITSSAAFGFSTIGNTPKSIADTNLLGHYAPLDGVSSLSAVAGLGAGTNGSATLVAGNYIFNPNAGVTGAATFKYRVSDGAGCTIPDQSADVSISNMVWYVDSSAAAGGDGRSSSPFQNFNNIGGAGGAGDSDAPNDFIYVLKGTGYTTGLALENGQQLIGESVDLIVNSQTLRPATPANVPTLTNGAGNGITLAGGNTISGFLVGTVSGTKLIGSSVGTATVNNLTLNGGGAALNINGGNLAVTIDSLSSSSSTNAVSLTGVTGSLTASAGAISGASGADVLVSGGTANLTFAGSINNTSGRSVDIQNRTGGSVTFSGAITDTASGIFLNANTGSSINFTGGLNLSTGSSNAFTATGGGTVNATQNNTSIVNTLTTTTGTALNISSTTIGGSGLTFRSISSSGATNGISLNTTGNSGGLTITGNSSGAGGGTITINPVGTAASFTAPDTADLTGGTIQNSTGAGILLNNVGSVSLTRIRVLNSGSDGISLSGATGFTLDHSFVTDNTGLITHEGLRLLNSSGVVTISNSTVGPSAHNGIFVDNFNVSMTAFNLTSTVVRDTVGIASNGLGNDGLLLVMRGNAVLTSGQITGSVFKNLFSVGAQIQTNDSGRIGANSGGVINAPVNSNSFLVQTSTFSGDGQGIDIGGSQISSLTFQVLNNTIIGKLTVPGAIASTSSSHAINAFTAAGADTGPTIHTFVGKIDGNVIGTQGVKDSGSGFGSGIRAVVQGTATQGVITISNNTIREVPNADIITVFGQNGAASSSSASAIFKFKIVNNTMPALTGSNLSLCGPANTPCASNGIFVLADEGVAVRNIITGNNIYDVSSVFGGISDIYLAERVGPPAGSQLTVEGTGGSNSVYIQANNTLAGPQKFIDEGGNTSQVGLGSTGLYP